VIDFDAEITLRRSCERLVTAIAEAVDESSEKCVALRLTAAVVESHDVYTAIRLFRDVERLFVDADIGTALVSLVSPSVE